MSEFVINKKFNAHLSEEDVIECFAEVFPSQFNKATCRPDGFFTGRVKAAFWNPVLDLKGQLKVHSNVEETRVMVTASTSLNGWGFFTFALTIILFLFASILLGIASAGFDFWLYSSQKQRTEKGLHNTLEQVEFKYDALAKNLLPGRS